MAIKFLCPNGHPLSCGDDRAGKPGKCPKCGTQFIVPDAEEIAAAASNGARQESQVPVNSAAGGGSSVAVKPNSPSGIAAGGGLPADQIVFLCPNGHRLNGPKSLQGRPGQCPHCGERFRIPVYEDEPADDEVEEFPAEEAPDEEEIPVGLSVDGDSTEESEAVETFPEEDEIVETFGEVPLEMAPSLAAPPVSPLPPGPSNQLFDVFSRLWPLKPAGSAVELLLKDGQKLTPTKYSPTLSRQAFGVFAIAEENGTFRVLTVAWDTVARVEFQKLAELPEGVFV